MSRSGGVCGAEPPQGPAAGSASTDSTASTGFGVLRGSAWAPWVNGRDGSRIRLYWLRYIANYDM
ncbi:MAG: hypothetical protein JO340_17770 [Acidobacteriaceae bacterium]|nr:hypothetical protein [Acidobacteriaceae bacterium]